MRAGGRQRAAGSETMIVAMGTFVTIDAPRGCDAAVERAFGWFREIEQRCSRFEAESELAQLSQHVGEPVAVSSIVFQAVQFALAVAEDTDGAFDPTVGAAMQARGFDRHYRTREHVYGGGVPLDEAAMSSGPGISGSGASGPGDASYRDVELDAERQAITLHRPLMLDLGAVAKGLAIDMAARELADCPWFAIDAGGDLFVGGTRPDSRPWTVGIPHPRVAGRLLTTVAVERGAVCTSGDYERRTAAGHHIIDPRRQQTAGSCSASATVVAPTAMLADALATAAFVLGGDDGIRLLERHGTDGLIVTADVECYATAGFRRTHPILQDAQGTADDYPGAAARDRDPGRGIADRCAGSC